MKWRVWRGLTLPLPLTGAQKHHRPCPWARLPSTLLEAARAPPAPPRRGPSPSLSASTTWLPATSTSPTTSCGATSTGTWLTSWLRRTKVPHSASSLCPLAHQLELSFRSCRRCWELDPELPHRRTQLWQLEHTDQICSLVTVANAYLLLSSTEGECVTHAEHGVIRAAGKKFSKHGPQVMRAFESANSFTVSASCRALRLFSDGSVNWFKIIKTLARIISKHQMLCLCRESN